MFFQPNGPENQRHFAKCVHKKKQTFTEDKWSGFSYCTTDQNHDKKKQEVYEIRAHKTGNSLSSEDLD